MNQRRRDPRRGERGFTLVELMIGAVLTALLIGMVFGIFVQTSSALRAQGQVSDLQQVLVSAETVIARDVRQAGLRIPNGFKVGWDDDVHMAVEIENGDDAPDELHVFAADTSKQAFVGGNIAGNQVTVDDAAGFAVGDVVVLSVSLPRPQNTDPTAPEEFAACIVKIAGITGTLIDLDGGAPWNGATKCGNVTDHAKEGSNTMMFGFLMRGYRIDPTRPALGVLQRSETAGIENDWEDLAIGVVDLQVASRWSEPGDVNDEDGDGDPELDWFSGDDQEALSEPAADASALTPVELTVSVVVRTTREVQGVVSSQTPKLTEDGNADHNDVGDRDAITLEGVPDAARPPALQGAHIYRWTTFRVDLRNLGVGL